MTIDWGELVSAAVVETDENGQKCGRTHSAGGYNGRAVGTEGTPQQIDIIGFVRPCTHLPTVPTIFEEHQDRAVFIDCDTPEGGGVQGRFAPEKEQGEQQCKACKHLRRPGLADGYCGGDRADLAYAYGPGHPLRKLPDDAGANCSTWIGW